MNINTILAQNTIYDFYIAAPWFTKEQYERLEFVKQIMKMKDKVFYSPKDVNLVDNTNDYDEREFAFEENLKAIFFSKAVFAVTNDKDLGTIWESGYGYALNKPIVYFAENLDGPFNLMLAQSAVRVITSRAELERWDFNIDIKQEYRGNIE